MKEKIYRGRHPLRVFDVVKALAFVGDLSMGQPTNHSLRTAWLAVRLAHVAELDAAAQAAVCEAALLRWSGCTANAGDFSDVFGDDIAVRVAMLEGRPEAIRPVADVANMGVVLRPLAQIHCEVSAEVGRLLALSSATETTLRHILEAWDGSGQPAQLAGDAVPATVSVVSVAGDIEVLGRTYGTEQALARIRERGDKRYPASLAALAARHAADWLAELEGSSPATLDMALSTPRMALTTPADLIADVIDLKLPWMTGFSRAVAATAAQAFGRLSSDKAAQERVYHAGLLHGLGRASVPIQIWNMTTHLPASAWETLRLVPYWTSRAGQWAGPLGEAATLASFAYERIDGSGYFRGARDQSLSTEARVLAASVAWVAMRSPRPWRAAMPADAAAQQLREDVRAGRLCGEAVDALVSGGTGIARPAADRTETRHLLSPRESDVLRAISRGATNKEAARALNLSPSTVATHVESVFRKLGCTTRAAATLKASAIGLL